MINTTGSNDSFTYKRRSPTILWNVIALIEVFHAVLAFSPPRTTDNSRLSPLAYYNYPRGSCVVVPPYGVSRLYRSNWTEGGGDGDQTSNQQRLGPIPPMPSELFQQLALSQLELLANSLHIPGKNGPIRKIKSVALYLPQENINTGQLEFSPAVIYPHPSTERVFIASDADSRVAPTLPRILTTLPGFSHAAALLPGYPLVSSGIEAGVGVVEEVWCDVQTRSTEGSSSGSTSRGGAALSVPLFAGRRTVGVLLASPAIRSRVPNQSVWTKEDRQQVTLAAKSLSLALSMDAERSVLQYERDQVQVALSDSLHQVKNPLQALRTFGKILQLRLASVDMTTNRMIQPQLQDLTDNILIQSDRLADRLKPVDAIVDSMGNNDRKLRALNPARSSEKAIVRVPQKPIQLPWDDDDNDVIRHKEQGTKIFIPPSPSPFVSLDSIPSFPISASSNNMPWVTHDSDVALKGKSGNTELEMTFIDDVLDPILTGFRAIASDRGIIFMVTSSDDLPGINIIPDLLQDAISNVIDNALKYVVVNSLGGRNPQPVIRIRLLSNNASSSHVMKSAAGVTILVEDNGPGIPIHERQRIFTRGVRGNLTSTIIEGSGIGLDIAKSSIECMGGTIQVVDNTKYPNSLSGTITEMILFRQPKS